MTTQPTPRPWFIGKENIATVDGFHFKRIPISAGGQAIGAIWNGSADRDFGFGNGQANAEYMIVAVNTHDDLVAALKHIHDVLTTGLSDTDTKLSDIASAALEKAGVK